MSDQSRPFNDVRGQAPNSPPADPVEYDRWFREQVEIGLREADDPMTTFYTTEEVFAALEERRQVWRAQAEKQLEVA